LLINGKRVTGSCREAAPYLYVSLKPLTGELFAMFLPRLDKEFFGLFVNRAKPSPEAEDTDGRRRGGGASA
jgi:hypothetical protein